MTGTENSDYTYIEIDITSTNLKLRSNRWLELGLGQNLLLRPFPEFTAKDLASSAKKEGRRVYQCNHL